MDSNTQMHDTEIAVEITQPAAIRCFRYAVVNGQLNVVRTFRESLNFTVDDMRSNYNTVLQLAAKYRHLDIVEELCRGFKLTSDVCKKRYFLHVRHSDDVLVYFRYNVVCKKCCICTLDTEMDCLFSVRLTLR